MNPDKSSEFERLFQDTLETYEAELAVVKSKLIEAPGDKTALSQLRSLTSGLETAVKAKNSWDKALAESAREMTVDEKLDAMEWYLLSLPKDIFRSFLEKFVSSHPVLSRE